MYDGVFKSNINTNYLVQNIIKIKHFLGTLIRRKDRKKSDKSLEILIMTFSRAGAKDNALEHKEINDTNVLKAFTNS